MNLPPEDNLRKEDKSSAPKVSFIRRFHCTRHIFIRLHAMKAPRVLMRYASVKAQSFMDMILLDSTLLKYTRGALEWEMIDIIEDVKSSKSNGC